MPQTTGPNNPMYERNEKVLCFHHEYLYEAKVLDDPQREDEADKASGWKYRVHYKGWKASWDDWVPQDRLRKLTDDNRELASSLRRDAIQAEMRRNPKPTPSTSKKGRAQGSEIGSGRGSEDRHSSVPVGGRGSKRGKDMDIEKVSAPISSSRNPGTSRTFFKKRETRAARAARNFRALQMSSSDGEEPGPGLAIRSKSHTDSKNATGSRTRLPSYLTEDSEDPKNPSFWRNALKIMAHQTIHGTYDEDGIFYPDCQQVFATGLYKYGEYKSPGLEEKTNKMLAEMARDRQDAPDPATPQQRKAARELQKQIKEDMAQAALEGVSQKTIQALSNIPPLDPPEYFTVYDHYSYLQKTKDGQLGWDEGAFWGSSLHCTFTSAAENIDAEAREKGVGKKYPEPHPEFVRTRVHDSKNTNALVYYNVDEPERKMPTAGRPSDPLHVAPPGSGGPSDALRQPDRLVSFSPQVLGSISEANLAKLDPAVVKRFPPAALRLLPARILRKFKIPFPTSDAEEISNEIDNQESDFYTRPRVKIPIPELLIGFLVDDWENVTKNLTIVDLPSMRPVNYILDMYIEDEEKKRRIGSAEAQHLEEIVDGLKKYFDIGLGKMLLFKFERTQYAELIDLWLHPANPTDVANTFIGPGDCYGIEHLLRMLSQLEEMIAQTNMDAQSVLRVREEVTLLMRWIVRNRERVFVNTYKNPGVEYIEAARD